MGFEYRQYSTEDFLSLAALNDDEWQTNHRNIAISMQKADPKIELCFIAFLADTIIGYIYGFALPNGTLIPEFLYVLPEYRNMGVGKHLLSILETHSGCCTSMIFYHKALHNYYEKLGYSTGSNLETAIKEIPSAKEH